ncbi:MAG: radical SAM protein [Candidatus Tectomicrobia bacterium]|nr:radical SAM protein [Candidatus Tectomicrobia bacterium]
MPFIQEITAKRILTPTGGFLNTFDFTLNPYEGCAFGCSYCYVRRLPIAIFRSYGHPWGRWVSVKKNAPDLLEEDGKRGKIQDARIFFSSATDPYQPAERTYRLTRVCLDILSRYDPQIVLLQTRSPLVERDIDILKQLGERVIVSMTIETDDEEVRRYVTPSCPPLRKRVEAIRAIHQAGINTQVAAAPLLPCDPERLAHLLEPVCDRVVLDNFFLGDGSGGKRSVELGMEKLFARKGWEEWFSKESLSKVLPAFYKIFGENRVGISQEGFNRV